MTLHDRRRDTVSFQKSSIGPFKGDSSIQQMHI